MVERVQPTRHRVPQDTLLSVALKTIQRHPVKCLNAWSPGRLTSLAKSHATARFTASEIRVLVQRALSLGHGWHDDSPTDLLVDAQSLALSNSTKISAAGFLRFPEFAPTLQALDLTNQFPLGDQAVASIVSACSGLRVLSLVGCRKVSNAALQTLLGLPQLAHLDVGGCYNISAVNLESFLCAHSNVKSFTGLGLSGLAEPAVLRAVSQRCSQLTWLSLGYTRASHDDLAGITRSCPRLSVLLLHWSVNASDELLTSVAESCPSLYQLDVSGCKGVTNAGLVAFAGLRAQLSGAPALVPDVASPSARRWDLDETEWMEFFLRCAQTTSCAADRTAFPISEDVEMTGASSLGHAESPAGGSVAQDFIRVIAAKHSGATKAVADQLTKMGAVLQIYV
jgi:hypothetical protein